MEAIVALLTDPNSVAHIALVYSAIVTIGLALGRGFRSLWREDQSRGFEFHT